MRSDLISEILGIGVVLMSFACAWLLMDYHEFEQSVIPAENRPAYYEISSGDTISSLASDFEKRGWIRDALYLKVYARLNKLGSIKVGEYAIADNVKAVDLIDQFIQGKVIQHQFTIIEGWSFQQMLDALFQQPIIKKTLGNQSHEQIMNLLGKPKLHPEGQFLPDTYSFPRHATDLQVLKTAHQALEKTLRDEWQNRVEGLPFKTPYEALTLASIVEKETGVGHERALIAGVFISRLRKNMKLQTDPTVIYGLGDQYQGNIKRKHLKEDTPYNTYVHKGLTPTPISLPGKAAIQAVMHPKEEGYLYFVAKADGSGEHYFSKNLKEHNQAVRKYQLKK